MDENFILQFIVNSINDNTIFIEGNPKAHLENDSTIVIEDEYGNTINLTAESNYFLPF